MEPIRQIASASEVQRFIDLRSAAYAAARGRTPPRPISSLRRISPAPDGPNWEPADVDAERATEDILQAVAEARRRFEVDWN